MILWYQQHSCLFVYHTNETEKNNSIKFTPRIVFFIIIIMMTLTLADFHCYLSFFCHFVYYFIHNIHGIVAPMVMMMTIPLFIFVVLLSCPVFLFFLIVLFSVTSFIINNFFFENIKDFLLSLFV